ncbi:hypothetical protein SUDANB145_07260 (plasmid) [Streptomyces sp. enrichment culture]|uniref:hypothetical protein n=1 Tax=Streptomyces sp. enrichment culture TaxID=1795815 RepID=UPI003F55B987
MPAPGGDRREELRAWLTANNIRPADVPLHGDLYLVPEPDGTVHIHYEAFHLTADGHKHVDEHGQNAAVERRHTPLLVAPPAWWEPYRKPTRDQLLAAVERIWALHQRNEHTGDCEHCSQRDYPDYAVPWPCPTVQALEEKANP